MSDQVYDYVDVDGTLSYQVIRQPGKHFTQRRPDAHGGWIYNLQGVKPLPYRLPETIEAVKQGETVYIPEGERDVHNLINHGITAITNSGGAGKWQGSFGDHLIGADVIILPDNDEPGRKHADKVARSLQGKAKNIKIVSLPGLPEKGDVSDWLEHGGTKEELLKMVAEAPEWEPQGQQETSDTDTIPGSSSLPFRVEEWPAPPDRAIYHGLAGEIVNVISPYSEADDVALLANLLAGFGSVIGRGPHFIAGADRHYTNLFAALVGDTAKGRKGMSWTWIRALLEIIDETWAREKTPAGLSSGEGLIWAVRDKIERKTKEDGWETVDEDISDKRLLVIEAEFASALKAMSRQGNTLSPVLRRAWETGDLQALTKNSPAKATGAHISIIGHITRDELLQCLTDTDRASGFANRFIWLCVSRSKCLPDGEALPVQELNRLAVRLNDTVQFARGTGEITRDTQAAALWRQVYPALSEGKPGLFGAVIARSEAQVMRLACLYALFDTSAVVQREHLKAALALWEYSENSCRYIFGASTKNATEAEILDALEQGHMTQNAIYELFDGNVRSEVYKAALTNLERQGQIRYEKKPPEGGKGRPAITWSLIKKK